MKKITVLTFFVTLFLVSTNAFAGGFSWVIKTTSIRGDEVESRQEAYNIGRDMITNYQGLTSNQIKNKFFNRHSNVDHNSFSITNLSVKVDEFLNSDGDVVYKPIDRKSVV